MYGSPSRPRCWLCFINLRRVRFVLDCLIERRGHGKNAVPSNCIGRSTFVYHFLLYQYHLIVIYVPRQPTTIVNLRQKTPQITGVLNLEININNNFLFNNILSTSIGILSCWIFVVNPVMLKSCDVKILPCQKFCLVKNPALTKILPWQKSCPVKKPDLTKILPCPILSRSIQAKPYCHYKWRSLSIFVLCARHL